MGRPTLDRPKKVFDPTPVEHITDECVFCKTTIPRKVLEQPGIIHADCHRPTCPDCIKQLKETGLWGCWYCQTVDIDERNPQIQKELEKIKEQKLKERIPIVDKFREAIPTMARTDQIITTDTTEVNVIPWHAATANTEEYPYRDGPNLLDKQEGWGAGPIYDFHDGEVKPGMLIQESVKEMGRVEKWRPNQADLLGVVGSKMMINKVSGKMKDLKGIAHLIMAGEKVDNKPFGKDETYGQIYGRIDWNGADTLAGYTLNENARSHIVAEIMKELETYYTHFDSNRLKEEAQRGTGRTVQRVKSVFGHFVDGPKGLRKDYDNRRILYLVDHVREAKRINVVMAQEWKYGFYRKLGLDTLNTIRDNTDVLPVKIALTSGGLAGKHYSLVIADITYAAMAQDGEKINKMLQYIGAPVIGDVITG